VVAVGRGCRSQGNDGRERGEDDTAFEKQAALFALAVSDVLMVNLWFVSAHAPSPSVCPPSVCPPRGRVWSPAD
jgi:hypothetical protein